MELKDFHALTREQKNSFTTLLTADTTIPPELRSMQARVRLRARGIGEATAKNILIAIAQRWAEADLELSVVKEPEL